MAYIQESSTWRARRRHRQWITLAVVFLLLVGAGAVAYGVWTGAIGGRNDHVDVAALPPCPQTTRAVVLTPDKVVVNVYNATTREGLANNTATALGLRSFAVGKIDNDPLGETIPGVAVIRYGSKGSAAAKLVATQVSGAKFVRDKRTTAVVDLVLGEKYTSLRPLASIATTAATTTPTCRPVTPTSSATPTAARTPTRKATTAR